MRMESGIPEVILEPGQPRVISLRDYFHDPDGDDLTYQVSSTPDLICEITGDDELVIREARSTGRTPGALVIFASDPWGHTTTSNRIRVRSAGSD